MKKFFYLAIVSIFLLNCSSSPTVEKNTSLAERNANLNSPSNSSQAEINQSNTNVEVRQPESNAVQILSPAVSKQNANSWEKKRGNGSGENPEPIAAIPLTTAAPDNSEISGTMNDRGVPIETRTFKDNPLLAKVEKIYTKANNPNIKVYLKNGKVINLPPGKISNPSTASANEILAAVGAIPKPAPIKNEAKSEIEKREQ